LAKGFKDEDGKFRPTERKVNSSKLLRTIRDDPEPSNPDSSRASELKQDKGRIKETRVFKFDDLESDVQEKVLESQRQKTMEFGDNFFAEDEGLIFDKETQFSGTDVFKNVIPKYFDVGSSHGTDFIQFELEPKEPESESEKKLSKFLGISEALRQKIQFRFINDSTRFGGENNTKLAFRDEVAGGEIDLDEEYKENPTAFENFAGFPKDKTPTREEFEDLQKAVEKWDDLMSSALLNLTSNYESQFTDEALKDDFDANESEFEADGTPA